MHCLPVLGREFDLKNYLPVGVAPREFVPESLRPYVRYVLTGKHIDQSVSSLLRHVSLRILHFNDRCSDIPSTNHLAYVLRRDLRVTKDHFLCGVYSTPFLTTTLKSMPGLQTVSFRLCQEPKAIHGLPWSVMQLVLSLPTLKDLAVDRHRFAPKLLAEEELTLDYCAPLTSFRYTLSDYRWWRKQTFPSEKQALLLVLNRTHASLERLTLIAELAPLDEICNTLEWPNLRELCLRGERGTIGNPPLPLVSMFANMLRLQRLELKLGLREGVDPQPFWPLGYVAEWPWADLRHLTLSYPLVNDQIYSSLPPTLESLALRYTPHMVHAERYDADLLWNWPLIKSSDMLQILRRCRCRRLSSMQLEYREDEADAELMQCVGASFPALTTFKLLRYRAANDAEAGPLVRRNISAIFPPSCSNTRPSTGCSPPHAWGASLSTDNTPPHRPRRHLDALLPGRVPGLRVRHTPAGVVLGIDAVACGQPGGRIRLVAGDDHALGSALLLPVLLVLGELHRRPR